MAYGFALVLLLLGFARVADCAAVGGIGGIPLPVLEEVPLCSSLLERIVDGSASGMWSGDGADGMGLTDDEDFRQLDAGQEQQQQQQRPRPRPRQLPEQRCDVTDIRCLIERGVILCRGNTTSPPVTTLVERGFQSMWHNPAVILATAVACCFAIVAAFVVITLARHWRELSRHRAANRPRPRRLSSRSMTTPAMSKLLMV